MRIQPKRRPVRYKRRVTLRSRFKQERSHRWGRRALWLALAAGMCAGASWAYGSASRFLSCSPSLAVRAIDVRGGKNVTASEIRALLPFRVGDNLLKIDIAAAEKSIQDCKPELKDISISRSWKGITVTLAERAPVAAVTIDGQRLGIDGDNVPFPLRGHLAQAPVPDMTAAAPEMRREMLRFVAALSRDARDIAPRVRWISCEANDILFGLADGPKVVWGGIEPGSFAGKLQRLREVIADGNKRFAGIECVNLSYYEDGRILVKPQVPAGPGAPPAA